MGRLTADIRLADEIWIAVALLHREQPQAADFSAREITARLRREGLSTERPGDRFMPTSTFAACARGGSNARTKPRFD